MGTVTITITTWLDLAREVFPDADRATLVHHLWEYTGYPGFFDGDPATACRRQLVEAKGALERGETFDMERGWHRPPAAD